MKSLFFVYSGAIIDGAESQFSQCRYSSDNTPYEKIGNNDPVSIADEVPFEIPYTWEWVRLGSISTYAETKQKINAQSADYSIWGLDLEDIEKGGRLIAHKTVGERKAVGDKTVFPRVISCIASFVRIS